MSNKWLYLLFVLTGLLLLTNSCLKENEEDKRIKEIFAFPEHFPDTYYQFINNSPSVEVFEIGRALFYDPILSLDSSIHCGSCHHQEIAFSDFRAISLGVHGRFGVRNSPPLFNLAWHSSFMWDGGITHIELMPVAPITDSSEMALPLRQVGIRLNQNSYYKNAFKQAMGVDSITDRHYLIAMAQFMSALISADSPYDNYIKGDSSALSESEIKGLKLFRQHCNHCHTEPLFTNYSFKVNGTVSAQGDAGRSLISNLEEDFGRFKVPSLRNISLSAPYMHDGRFSDLDQVFDHYESPGNHPFLDSTLVGGISLSEQERQQLKAFLLQLRDEAFTQNHNLSNPWR